MKTIIEFFTDTIFRKQFNSRRVRWFARQYKLLFYTVRGLTEHGTVVRCAALSYYTVISIVPILALVFAILKGFGMIGGLVENLYAVFPRNPEIVDYVVDFADKALKNTQGGVVAVFGVVMLFWAVIRVFGSIESAFNNIWEVKSSRSLVRQYIDYIALIVVVPILWVGLNWLAAYAGELLGEGSPLVRWTGIAGSLLVPCVVFSLLYYAIPNTRVKIASAVTAGIIAGVSFVVFQWAYVYIQQVMTSYNAIYGSFAALPLFLLWVQISWEILLMGGELSFAYQNIGRFDEERESLGVSAAARHSIGVAVMAVTARKIMQSSGAVSYDTLRDELQIPVRLLNSVVYTLAEAGLLAVVESKDGDRDRSIAATVDFATLRVADVVAAMDNCAQSRMSLASGQMCAVEHTLEQLQQRLNDMPENIRVLDLKICEL